MKTTNRFVILASIMALGIAGISVPTAQADPGSTPPIRDSQTSRPERILFATGDTVTEVRLVTGDLVGLRDDGEVTQVTPGPRPDGSVPTFSMTTAESQVYVIPADVEAFIPDQLDQQLFNVTQLSSSNVGDLIPVIVDQADNTPVQAGAQVVANMGVEVTESLDSVSAQVGLADGRTDMGPAPTWGLLEELSSAPTGSDDPVSSTTKVWLDKQVHVVLPQAVPIGLDTDEPAWMNLIGRDEAQSEGYTGEGVTVAVVDTGIDSTHPDLVGQVVAERDFTYENITKDYVGHGTFVASEIAGTGVASGGVYTGVAPGVKLISARVLDSFGGGSDSSIVAGVEWAAEQGADIINMSLGLEGGYDDGTSFASEAVNQISRQYGCLIVVAAGNDGLPQSVSTPATADEALSVSATYENGMMAGFSSYGPRRGDGAVKPEILAPGSGAPGGEGMVGAQAGTTTYRTAEGTSMAAPLVAGAAALLKQADPSLDRNELRATLMASANQLPLSIFQQGAGMLDIPAALAQTVTTIPSQLNLGSMTTPYPEAVTATLTYVNDGADDLTFDLVMDLEYTQNLGLPVDLSQGDLEPERMTALQADALVGTIIPSQLTVPAGGSTSLDVTVNPALYPMGYVGGYLTASSVDGTVIRTPIGWSNSPDIFSVTVSSDSDPLTSVRLVNLDTGEYDELAPDDNGTVVFSPVVLGFYLIEAYSMVPNPDYGDTHIVMPTAPFHVESDTSIQLDPSAAQPVTFDFDKPITQDEDIVFSFVSTTGDILYESDEFYFFGAYEPYYGAPYGDEISGDRLAVMPVSDTTDGTWHLLVDEYAQSPLVEASVDCGQTTLPMRGYVQSAGQTSYTIVDDNLGLTQAPGPDSALLTSWDDDFSYSAAQTLITQAENAGYAALIVDSTHPTWAENTLADSIDDWADTHGHPLSMSVLSTPRPVGDQLLAPGVRLDVLSYENPRYAYQFSTDIDLSGDQAFTVTPDGHTAAITVEHRAMGPKVATDRLDNTIPGITVSVPSTYTVYADSGVFWNLWTEYAPDFSSENYSGTEDMLIQYFMSTPVLGAGEQFRFAPGSQVNSLTHERAYVERVDDTLYVGRAGFRDGQGSVESLRGYDSDYPDFGRSIMTLTDLTTSEVIFDGDPGDEITTTDVTQGHTYQLDMVSTTPGSLWDYSNSVAARWTWDLQWGDYEDEPLREVWYELPGLDAYNFGSESQEIVMHVGHMGESAPPVEQVVLEASFDSGASWVDIPVQRSATAPEGSTGSLEGEDLYVGQIHADNGDMVWLRSSVSGGGSSFDQTIENAYPVTSSPRDFPVQTWSCTGQSVVVGDVTPPDAPKVDRANAAEVAGDAGAAEPGSTVTVTFPDGTKGTAVAGADGSYSVATLSGMVSGSVFVTATDDSGNVSDPTTLWLDADRPDPARVDRSDLTEVSGGVGAVEALGFVTVTFPNGASVTTAAAENGSYAVATPSGISGGVVTVTVMDAAGNTSDPTTATLVVGSPLTVTVRYSGLNPGEYQSVTASGFQPWERVTISLCSGSGCSTVLTTLATSAGKLTASVFVPSTATPGEYTVTLTGSSSGTASASFEVQAPPPPPTSQNWFNLLIRLWLRLLGL